MDIENGKEGALVVQVWIQGAENAISGKACVLGKIERVWHGLPIAGTDGLFTLASTA